MGVDGSNLGGKIILELKGIWYARPERYLADNQKEKKNQRWVINHSPFKVLIEVNSKSTRFQEILFRL